MCSLTYGDEGRRSGLFTPSATSSDAGSCFGLRLDRVEVAYGVAVVECSHLLLTKISHGPE